MSVLAGTVFQDTHLPLTVWFRAMWHMTSQKNGMSALGLQRVLGLGSYKTAQNMREACWVFWEIGKSWSRLIEMHGGRDEAAISKHRLDGRREMREASRASTT